MEHHPSAVAVRPVESKGDRDAAFWIRQRVFQDEQKVPPELEFDADDETAMHFVAVIDGEVIGTGRLMQYEGYAKVGRMAVLRDRRRRGVGRALLEAMIAEAARRGVTHLVLHAQVQAIGFYQRCGFSVTSDEFDEAGIPHRRMERNQK
jgi:predicted GNAT family N-acyltransferase